MPEVFFAATGSSDSKRRTMNYIIAIVQPPRVDAVREALTKVGVTGLTVSDAQGYGRQKGHAEVYRGHEYTVNFVRKVKLEIACESHLLDKVIEAISIAAKTGEGKV